MSEELSLVNDLHLDQQSWLRVFGCHHSSSFSNSSLAISIYIDEYLLRYIRIIEGYFYRANSSAGAFQP